MKLRLTALAAAFALAACSTTPTAEVTRFHLGQPMPSDTIRVIPAAGSGPADAPLSLEFRTFAGIVAQDLARHGFRPVETGPTAYVAVLDVRQTTQAGIPKASPFQIGIGAGSFGGNVGVGGSVNVPVGAPRNTDVRVNALDVRIRRQSDNTAIWEGRAVQQIAASAQGSTLPAAVPALSGALFKEFPGISGRTVIVPLR